MFPVLLIVIAQYTCTVPLLFSFFFFIDSLDPPWINVSAFYCWYFRLVVEHEPFGNGEEFSWSYFSLIKPIYFSLRSWRVKNGRFWYASKVKCKNVVHRVISITHFVHIITARYNNWLRKFKIKYICRFQLWFQLSHDNKWMKSVVRHAGSKNLNYFFPHLERHINMYKLWNNMTVWRLTAVQTSLRFKSIWQYNWN